VVERWVHQNMADTRGEALGSWIDASLTALTAVAIPMKREMLGGHVCDNPPGPRQAIPFAHRARMVRLDRKLVAPVR